MSLTYTSGFAYGKAQGDVFVPEIWSSEVKRFRDQNLIMADKVKRISFVGQKGDLLHIPSISRLAVNTKASNTQVTIQNPTETEYTMVIDKYRETSMLLEDLIVDIQSSYDLRSEYTREAGYAIARDMDAFLLAQRAVIPNTANQRITSGAAITEANILAAKQFLDQNDVPQEGRCLLVSPKQYIDLLQITVFRSRDFINGSPVENAMLGMIYGIPVYQTSMITLNSATGFTNGSAAGPTPGFDSSNYYYPSQSITTPTALTSARFSAIMFQKDWLIAAVQQEPKVESSRETLFLSDAFVVSDIYAAKEYRPDHAVLIETI